MSSFREAGPVQSLYQGSLAAVPLAQLVDALGQVFSSASALGKVTEVLEQLHGVVILLGQFCLDSRFDLLPQLFLLPGQGVEVAGARCRLLTGTPGLLLRGPLRRLTSLLSGQTVPSLD